MLVPEASSIENPIDDDRFARTLKKTPKNRLAKERHSDYVHNEKSTEAPFQIHGTLSRNARRFQDTVMQLHNSSCNEPERRHIQDESQKPGQAGDDTKIFFHSPRVSIRGIQD